MTWLIFRNFIKQTGIKTGLLFLFCIGIISLLVGKQFIDSKKQQIVETEAYQEMHIKRNIQFHKEDTGLLFYYLKFSLVNETSPINSLAIGQRDINPSVQSVTIRTLEAQKYDAELNNPNNLLSGNIDFSFVLVYLFPLLIIAFSYNIISEEQESGTWKIVTIQSRNLFGYILTLFFVRFIAVSAIFSVILFAAVPFLNISLNASFFAFWTVGISYIIFWFSICFLISSLRKSSNFNALVLLTIWLFLIIILPAAINNYIVNKYPVPEALALTVKQRKGYHEKWDMDKNATMSAFYRHYPQFKAYGLPDKEFSWIWYYAMQQMGDDESAAESTNLQQKLEQRNATCWTIAQFVPTLNTQMQLNEIAKSDLGNQLRFMNNIKVFHEQIRLYFYPKIFENTPVGEEDLKKFKIKTFTDTSKINLIKSITPLTVLNGMLLLFAVFNFKRRNDY